MALEWFKQRTYRHLDLPVEVQFLSKVTDPAFVATHSFSPLILRPDETPRYKPALRKTTAKIRPVMYVSHRDAAILAWYAKQLSDRLEARYAASKFGDCVVAYRALGKANYHFASEAYRFAKSHMPCIILAFDVTGFFDNLSHARLKQRLKDLLGVSQLPDDWYSVFRASTNFSFVELAELKKHPSLGKRFAPGEHGHIATVRELKDIGVSFKKNGAHLSPPRDPCGKGIPQGTPLSAVLSNAYMLQFDEALEKLADEHGAFFRRYSDDILLICAPEDADFLRRQVETLIKIEGLELNAAKTEITRFGVASKSSDQVAQYLGFSLYPEGAGIRPSSLSRAWRKMRVAVRAAEVRALKSGKPLRTKVLQKRFSPVFDVESQRYLRSFPSYAIRSAREFGPSQKVSKQLRRLQAGLQREIAAVRKNLSP